MRNATSLGASSASAASFVSAVSSPFFDGALDRFLRGFTVSAQTVRKDMHDRHEIFGELGLWRLVLVVENHELHLLPLEQPSDELESESAESVSVGNGNRAYFSVKRSFQKGFKPFALEVEAAADVFDDVGVWAPVAEVGDLAFEVCLLAGGGDATVCDCSTSVVLFSGFGEADVFGRMGVCSRDMTAPPCEKALDVVETGSARRTDARYFTGVRPPPKRFYGDS